MEIIRQQGEVLYIPLSLFLHHRAYYESSGRTKLEKQWKTEARFSLIQQERARRTLK